ncbi:hypothetical protein [Pseudomonas capeferrum]
MSDHTTGEKEWERHELPFTRNNLTTTVLREAWAKQLRDIAQAKNMEALSSKLHHSAGWLTGLFQAQVIDSQAFETYQRERLEAETLAKLRFTSKDSR